MLMIKNLSLKIMILLEYPNIKTLKGGKLFVTWKCYDSSFNI